MKRSRFTEERIVRALNEHQSELSVAEFCQKHGIMNATFYQWQSKYSGVEVSEPACREAA